MPCIYGEKPNMENDKTSEETTETDETDETVTQEVVYTPEEETAFEEYVKRVDAIDGEMAEKYRPEVGALVAGHHIIAGYLTMKAIVGDDDFSREDFMVWVGSRIDIIEENEGDENADDDEDGDEEEDATVDSDEEESE